jgi:DNA-binding GntR family transcriptional regulator
MVSREGGNWLSMSEIARRRGVSRAAICMQVNKLNAAGMLEVRRGNGLCLVDVRAYEAATGLAVPAKAPARIERRAQAQSTPTAGDLLRQARRLAGEAASLVREAARVTWRQLTRNVGS